MSPFERLLADLVRADVAFATVGGVACAFVGHVRTTDDVHIVVDPDPVNIGKLLAVLAGFGEGHACELDPTDFTDEPGAIRIVEDFPLDVFTRMGELSWADLVPHIRRTRVGDVDIPHLDIEGLIRVKGPSLRERDRIDVAVLRELLSREHG